MVDTFICADCGERITGRYVRALGRCWHPEHLRCAACGEALGSASSVERDGRIYHFACRHRAEAPCCDLCGAAFRDRYLVDYWGTRFCPEHHQVYPPCAFCGRLIPPGDLAAPRASPVCRHCAGSAIYHSTEAGPEFARAVQWVNRQGLWYERLELRVELRGPRQLADFVQLPVDVHTLGATVRRTFPAGGGDLHTEVVGVGILRGLPATLFRSVAVHELGHTWLGVRGILSLSAEDEEGFCQLLSHRYLRELHTREGDFYAECIEQSPDPVYGDGFRAVQAIAHDGGFAALPAMLVQHGSLVPAAGRCVT